MILYTCKYAICYKINTKHDLLPKIFHDSRADIIETQAGSVTGFLAEDAEEYAKVLACIIHMHPDERNAIRIAARYRYNNANL